MPCSLVFPKRIFQVYNYYKIQQHVSWLRGGWAHITPVLESLHWLPVCFRIDFKVLLMVFKCLNGLGPSYLSELLLPYKPSRTLGSSGSGLLVIPKVRTRTHREASFQHYGPRLWNSLPEDLRAAENVHVFKSRLKTHLFSLAFN